MEPVDVTAKLDLTPYHILSLNTAGGQQAIKDAADRELALRNWQLQNATEFGQRAELQDRQLQAEKDIAKWHQYHDDALAERYANREQANMDRMQQHDKDVAEMARRTDVDRTNRDIQTKIISMHGKLPSYDVASGETPDTYNKKLLDALDETQTKYNNNVVKQLKGWDDHISKIDTAHRAAAESFANANALPLLMRQLSETGDPRLAQYQALTQKGVTPATALQKVGLVNDFTNVKSAIADQEFQRRIAGDRARTDLVSRQAMLSQLHPDLDWRDEQAPPGAAAPDAGKKPPGGDFASALDALLKGNGSSTAAAPASSAVPATGIPSLDDAVKQQRIAQLATQRNDLNSKLLSLDSNIAAAVKNPIVMRGHPIGGVIATPQYDSPEEQAQAVLQFQSRKAPVQASLDSVNDELRNYFQ